MFIERKVNHSTNTVELWKCEWENPEGASAKKRYVHKLREEQPLKPEGKNTWNQVNAICWASGRTLGNIAVFSKSTLGSFPAQAGDDAFLPCDFVPAGKFRHGADRWWSRTHQTHWGTKADHESADRSQEKGIHVHVNDGAKRIVDDTFSVVTLNGKTLERKDLLQAMFERTIT